jgi:uncharacterized membrane protein HdeD (DUF308 family)
VKSASGWVAVLGILVMLFGGLAIATPMVAGVAVAFYVGVLMLLGGVFEVVAAITGLPGSSRGWTLLQGALAVFCGVYLLAEPLQAMVAITLMLSIIFILDGISRAVFAALSRPESGWVAAMLGGIATLLLGGMIYAQWPVSGAWAIGLLVGVRMLVGGSALLTFGGLARSAASAAP